MKRCAAPALLSCCVMLLNACAGGPRDTRSPRGPYLGQAPPETRPEVFGPGIISTEASELNCAFTPDGDELFFTRRIDDRNTLMTMRQENGRWTMPEVASFSGTYSDVDPFVTRDGATLFFSSSRPLDAGGAPKDADLWYALRSERGGWGAPVRSGLPNSEGKDDYYTSMTDDGTLYFSIFESHASGGDIYRAGPVNGGFGPPERIGNGISTEWSDHDPFVAPDGSYLIFTSDRPGGFGSADLYIAFRDPEGAWTQARNMGNAINSPGYDFCPMVSPDGRYFFFTRNIDRNGEIYWVDAKILESFEPGAPR